MARVTLFFEDAPDGLIDFRADHVHGYDHTSKAHQLAGQVIQFLEREATQKTIRPDDHEPVVVLTDAGILHR